MKMTPHPTSHLGHPLPGARAASPSTPLRVNFAGRVRGHFHAWRAPQSGANTTWPASALLLILVLLAALPYLNTLLNGFVYDDNTQVLNNPYIQNFHHLGQIFTTTVWSYIGVQGVTNYYRPMMTVGYLIGHELFGRVAYGYHLVSLLFHVAVVMVLFALTRSMFKRRDIAFFASAAFALHPIHTESVAWIAAVTDLELTFFYLVTFWFFVRLARPAGARSEEALLGMVAGFVLALLSKEQALTLPVLATIYEHGYRDDRFTTTWRQKLERTRVLWLLALGYLVFRVRVLGGLAPVTQMTSLSWTQTLLSAVRLTGDYFGKLIWPARLSAFYVFRKSASVWDPRVLLGLLGLLLACALFVFLWKRARMASFGLIWLLATLAPVLNARWMAANVFAERYLYLPSIGFCWVLATGLAGIWYRGVRREERLRPVLAATLALVAIACAARIVIRNRDWANDIRLYTHTLQISPDAYPIRNNLGTVYWVEGRVEAAATEWARALELAPANAIILNNLGLARARQKRYAEAESLYQRAIEVKPNYTDPHLNLGVMEVKEREKSKAELQLRAAVALSPLNIRARNELGKLYLSEGRQDEAKVQFKRSVESEPNATAWDELGEIAFRQHQSFQAEAAFHNALALNPFDSEARFGLARLSSEAGKDENALREYEAGLRTDPKNTRAQAEARRLRSELTQEKHALP